MHLLFVSPFFCTNHPTDSSYKADVSQIKILKKTPDDVSHAGVSNISISGDCMCRKNNIHTLLTRLVKLLFMAPLVF